MSENNVPDSEKKRIFGKIKSFLPGKKEHDVEKEFPVGRTVIVKLEGKMGTVEGYEGEGVDRMVQVKLFEGVVETYLPGKLKLVAHGN